MDGTTLLAAAVDMWSHEYHRKPRTRTMVSDCCAIDDVLRTRSTTVVCVAVSLFGQGKD